MEQTHLLHETVPITPSLIERMDFSDLSPADRTEMVMQLYRFAPPWDGEKSQRLWVAARLGIPLRAVSKILWRQGVRWPQVPRRRFTKHGLQDSPPATASIDHTQRQVDERGISSEELPTLDLGELPAFELVELPTFDT
jgi:hypothetical protein